jgi:alkylation response protein AidB-like acyl-CoA dehydrogenase
MRLKTTLVRDDDARADQDHETFAATFIPSWAEREREAVQGNQTRLHPETVAEMRTSGILAAPIPTALGGWGWSLFETMQMVRWLAQRAPATALALAMPLGNAATTRIPDDAIPQTSRDELWRHQEWMAEQVLQGKILAVANSEPGAGGDLANTKTTVQRDGVGYSLTGRKSFATFGPDADYFLCAARRMDNGVVDGFFVACDAIGLTLDKNWNPIGMKPTASVGLALENAPAAAILGFPGSLEGVNARHWSTLLFAAVCLGIGEGALREGATTAGEGMWAKAKLAESALQLDAAAGFLEALTMEEVWPFPATLQERARRAKTFAAKVAVDTATHAVMISGGRAYVPNHPAFRFLCDALAGPLVRPPLPQAMDAIIKQMFPAKVAALKAVA